MQKDDGRPGGLSSDDGAASVSTLRASIPDAVQWWPLVLAAYDAGVKRGNDEATAFDWGERLHEKYHEELVSAVHDWMNEGRDWRAGDIVSYDAAHAVVAQAIEARRAETGTGSVHESAAPQECVQTTPEDTDHD